MNIDHLRKKFSNETVCRQFFESVIWKDGRHCPHCGHAKSCRLHGAHLRAGVYECYRCKRQFTATTKTPLHSTKLPLWKWLQAMYYIVNSSKGISSVVLARWLGVPQPTAWKLGHCIRAMMDQGCQTAAILNGIVELDEKYLGAKPRFEHGLKHKRGRGTAKQCLLIAVQRQGPVRAAPVKSNQVQELSPLINSWVSRQAHLMSDEHAAYRSIAKGYAAHSTVNQKAISGRVLIIDFILILTRGKGKSGHVSFIDYKLKGTLFGYKVNRRWSEVVMVSQAKEISNRRCGCAASRHGEGHRKGRGIPKRCRSRSVFGAIRERGGVAKTNDTMSYFFILPRRAYANIAHRA